MRYESNHILPYYYMASTKAIAFIPPVVLPLLTEAYPLLVLAFWSQLTDPPMLLF